MKCKSVTLLAAVFISVLLLVAVGCQQSGVEQAAGGETGPDDASATTVAGEAEATSSGKTGAEARAGDGSAAGSGEAEVRAGDGQAQAGDATAGNSEARAGDVVAGDGDGGEARVEAQGDGSGDPPGRVRLEIEGEPGTRFSGMCTVGGEEREVSGRVPERFIYEPDGREVECEVRTLDPDAGPLTFSVIASGENQRQRIRATGDTISLAYSGNSISYTTSSASGAASQSSTITSSSSSSSSVSSSSGSR
ncbi:MAG: hypothetical protein M3157_02615 [Actinomycetota bacterium]|nr:hypothetical protein [Actinomycetota bacterium]